MSYYIRTILFITRPAKNNDTRSIQTSVCRLGGDVTVPFHVVALHALPVRQIMMAGPAPITTWRLIRAIRWVDSSCRDRRVRDVTTAKSARVGTICFHVILAGTFTTSLSSGTTVSSVGAVVFGILVERELDIFKIQCKLNS
jgi:hypothetical protein